ncbi:hypothetical protein EVAR_23927_1 [Eumeta japonica]|uniref:Uncharacterized protein n=1 Tax=Eumeta variegata TaxID=151549 RepID=A0A4C1V155_EUMVA|nr:hypothetical protein EVAR_23927_1 [Eumeta japonica]
MTLSNRHDPTPIGQGGSSGLEEQRRSLRDPLPEKFVLFVVKEFGYMPSQCILSPSNSSMTIISSNKAMDNQTAIRMELNKIILCWRYNASRSLYQLSKKKERRKIWVRNWISRRGT